MNADTFAGIVSTALDFYGYLSKVTPLFLVLGGALGFYYREKIKAILARSLSQELEALRANFSKDIATHTAVLQRELEAYKVGLIAEAERIKAGQDVRKSIALKVAERRFDAIARLLDAHMGIDTDICALVTFSQSTDPADNADFLQRKSDLLERLSEYSNANDQALIFIEPELRRQVLEVRRNASAVLGLRAVREVPAIAIDHHDIAALLRKSAELEHALRKLLVEFEKA